MLIIKNILKLLSGKDILFGVVIFSLVIVFSVFIPSNKVLVTFEENAVDIKSSKYTMNIPYKMVNNIELTDLPELGKKIDGYDDMILMTGTWKTIPGENTTPVLNWHLKNDCRPSG